MELTEAQIKQIEDTHDVVVRVSAILLGVNGNPGLVKRVEDVCTNYEKLNTRFWILVATLVGSGALGGGIWAILRGAGG